MTLGIDGRLDKNEEGLGWESGAGDKTEMLDWRHQETETLGLNLLSKVIRSQGAREEGRDA